MTVADVATPPHAPRPGAALTTLILSGALATLISVKMLVTFDAFPGWTSDPTIADTALGVAITPATQLALNAAIILLAAAITLLSLFLPAANRSAGTALRGLLLALGIIALIYHLQFNPGASVEDWLASSDLAAAICAGAACSSLPRGSPSHRALTAILIGAVVLVAAKGSLQFFMEHQQTVDAYRASRERILASNGWSVDSPMALAYERRLMQREATGWFGLSNVFASVVGAGAVALAGLALLSPKGGTRKILWLAAAFAAGGLVMSQSKGGAAASAIGFAVLLALVWLRSHPFPALRRLLPTLAILLVAAGQIGILARGLIGDRLGELSLLFRSFYIQGAAKIFASNPTTGVGPAGFKDAYMSAKPSISPEDVASPHSLPWDLLATLGLGGGSLFLLWLSWIWLAGRSASAALDDTSTPTPEATDTAHPSRWLELRIVALCAACAVLVSVWVERGATSPETAAMKVAALLCWVATSIAVSRSAASLTIPLCAASATLAIHSQIEMTPIWTGSGSWLMAIIGLAASCSPTPLPASHTSTPPTSTPAFAHWKLTASLLSVAASLAVLVSIAARYADVANWQSLLHRAAERTLTVTRLREAILQADMLAQSPAHHQEMVADAVGASGLDLPPLQLATDAAAFDAALTLQTIEAWDGALADLLVAASIFPQHGPTHRAASQLALRLAEATKGDDHARYVRIALDEADRSAVSARQKAAGLSWSATVRMTLIQSGQLDPTVSSTESAHASRSLQAATQIDPYNFLHTAQLARIELLLGHREESRRWAAKTLELESLGKLDPLKRLDVRSRAEMESLVQGS